MATSCPYRLLLVLPRQLLVWRQLLQPLVLLELSSVGGRGIGAETLGGAPYVGHGLLLCTLLRVLRGRSLQQLLLVQHLCCQLALQITPYYVSTKDTTIASHIGPAGPLLPASSQDS